MDENFKKQFFFETEKLALENIPKFQYQLGKCYEEGFGTEKNDEEALNGI